MTTANFHARLERIQKAQAQAPAAKTADFRAQGAAGIAASRNIRRIRRQRRPIMDQLVNTSLGVLLGALVAVALIGLSMEGSLWGPGTVWHDIAYYPTLAALGLAPLVMLISLFTASSRPGFALFSLGYLSGIVVPLFI
ncbi:MAG: hypothetical protein AAGI36_15185 [Pseudomonadota bacterium]